MILEVDIVAIEVEDNVLNAHTVIVLDTPVIDAISYIIDLPVLLIWLSLLIIQRVEILSQGAHPHLKGSFLRPTNMRSTFVSLKQPNLPSLLMLPRPVMFMLALHIHLHLESLIPEPHIISLVIKIFFLLLPFPSPLPTITLSNGSPLLLLSKPVMFLLVLHVHLQLRSLILEPQFISLVIKTFFLLIPFRLLYPILP